MDGRTMDGGGSGELREFRGSTGFGPSSAKQASKQPRRKVREHGNRMSTDSLSLRAEDVSSLILILCLGVPALRVSLSP